MDWIKKNPEKVVLLMLSVICLGLGVKHILAATGLPAKFETSAQPPKAKFPEPENGPVIQSDQILKADFIWVPKEVPLPGGKQKEVTTMRSVWIIEKDGKLIDPLNPDSEQIRPPVSNQWLLENKLDFLSRNVLEKDPDSDGFSNLDEWHGKTSPVDPEDHPSYIRKLLFAERKQQNFTLKFAANNKPSFQVNVNDRGRRKSQFVRVGETFYQGRFEVMGFAEKEGKNASGITTDRSELQIRDHTSGKDVTLIVREELPWPTFFAEFNFTLDPGQSQFYVREGESFSLNLDPGTWYTLIGVTEDTVKVEPAAGGEPVTLQKGALLAFP